MSQRKDSSLLSGLLLISGLVVGAASAFFYKENKAKHAGVVLEAIKEEFAREGEVVGSWIDYDAAEYHGYDSRPLVYYGGISRIEADQVMHYSFVADIYTGEIIDIELLDQLVY